MPEGSPNKNSLENSTGQTQENFVLVESNLKARIERENPKLPENQRRLRIFTNGVNIGVIERLRDYNPEVVGAKGVWLVIDFDDVINLTTSSSLALFKQLSDATGISEAELQKLYEQSKQETATGKKLFRFNNFIDTVKIQSKAPGKVQEIVDGFDFGAFIDQGVRRAILALRALYPSQLRISVLTYGDPEYQKMRLEQTDLEDMVDDVIYTEESKMHIIQALSVADYQSFIPSVEDATKDGGIAVIDTTEPVPVGRPFIVMVDDSPENLRDYRQLLSYRGLTSVRWKNSQAKRVNVSDHESTQPRIVITDGPKNKAAVRLFETVQAAVVARDELLAGGEDAVLDVFRNESKTSELLKSKGASSNLSMGNKNIDLESFIQAA